ncbi:hypothetical protein F2P81_022414 [Scophthalmus maximus]|uniref:Uncharacterized protein n=1 Tax=Scophthalmus maximus TaxID=52904 RepID=A0A6A4RU74_SCOMX|nr:hypothetical protein F2P81_022414 [Scophthalmus maximus]
MSLAVKYDSVPSFDCALMYGCDSPFDCRRHLNFTLIPLSLMGTSGLDRQPGLEILKCLICVSSEEAVMAAAKPVLAGMNIGETLAYRQQRFLMPRNKI